MSNLRLNYDVLLHVLHVQASDKKSDIVPMMQTCKVLQRAGAPLLFRGGVVICQAKALMSFYRFMLSDKTRFRYLRRLRLGVPELPSDQRIDSALSRVFRRAHELEELHIDHSDFLDNHPATSMAISELTELKTVSLMFGDCRAHDKLRDMLINFQSNVHTLSVSFWHDSRFDDPGDPITLLEGVAPHLEALLVNHAYFDADNGPQYPRLKLLSCEESCYMYSCRPLILAYPNLVWLEVPEWKETADRMVEHRRRVSIVSQQELRWHELGYLEGSLISLYGLAPQCPVTLLRLDVGEEEREASMLPIVLGDSQPVHLVMHVHPDFQFAPHILDSAALRMKHFAVRIFLHDSQEDPAPQQIFVCVAVLTHSYVYLLTR